jgi:hypothetical protein
MERSADMAENFLASHIKGLAKSGPVPGQRFPDMGKPPFKAPTPSGQKAMPAGSLRQTLTMPAAPQQAPNAGPVPAMLRQKPPPVDKGSAVRASPKQGLPQRDGVQSGYGDRPSMTAEQKAGPVNRTNVSATAPRSGIEAAMHAQADKLHPRPGQKSSGRR